MTQELQPKKSISLTVIALSIICIILAASTIGALTLYRPDEELIDEKDQTIETLNEQISLLTNQVGILLANQSQASSSQSEIAYLNGQLTTLGNDYTALQSTYATAQKHIRLEFSEQLYNSTVHQKREDKTSIYKSDNDLAYAGYLLVEATSNSTTAYVQLTYNYVYDNKYIPVDYIVPIEKDHQIILPLLPSKFELFVGNNNAEDDNKVSAIVTLYY
ncbi:MAG: hypothetical protein LBQ98_05690 [Nitrososphaerota archaeon]|jgi:hypothetical protein|nr:hypothetical protein [Nitrososphaerota archaeon]